METLEQKIAAAEAAKQQVDAAKELEQLAGSLPALRRQQQLEERRAQLGPAIERAEAEAAATLQRVAPKIKRWRERWIAAHEELIALASELQPLQSEIGAAGRYAVAAAEYRLEVEGRLGQDNELPLGMGADGLSEIWERVGGSNPDLAPLPLENEQKHESLLRIILGRPFVLYRPSVGHKLIRGI